MSTASETKSTVAEVTPLRQALDRLARKWTLALPGGAPTRHQFFGAELNVLLSNTKDSELTDAAEALADNWNNAGIGIPEGLALVRGYFAFDVQQAVKTSKPEPTPESENSAS